MRAYFRFVVFWAVVIVKDLSVRVRICSIVDPRFKLPNYPYFATLILIQIMLCTVAIYTPLGVLKENKKSNFFDHKSG